MQNPTFYIPIENSNVCGLYCPTGLLEFIPCFSPYTLKQIPNKRSIWENTPHFWINVVDSDDFIVTKEFTNLQDMRDFIVSIPTIITIQWLFESGFK